MPRFLLCAFAAALSLLVFTNQASAQSEPNLENGFKPYGTYSGSNIDSVNLENGNLLLHIPMPFTYPQRGKAQPSYFLGVTSKQWSKTCAGSQCWWFPAFSMQDQSPSPAARGTGVGFDTTADLAVLRTHHQKIDTVDSGLDEFSESVTQLNTADGATHQAVGVGSYVTTDATGFLIVESNPDANGINQTVTIRDRSGNVYSASAWQKLNCKESTQPDNSDPQNPGTITTTDCTEVAHVTAVTDSNGNTITFGGQDTLGRSVTLEGFTNKVATADYSGCISPASQPISSAILANYTGFNGAVNQVKVCYSNINLSTSFGQANTTEYPGGLQEPPVQVVASVYFPVDGSTWSFQYDSYGNVTYLDLPLGGSIQYQWQTVTLPSPTFANASRAVSQRTLTDNNGHSYTWKYSYGSATFPNPFTNTMTDPLGNDTANTFTPLQGVNNLMNSSNTKSYFLTTSKHYQGLQSTGNLLQQEDLQYYNNGKAGDANAVNGFATQITTTTNGEVSRVVRLPDSGGYGDFIPNFGVVTSEKHYDFDGSLLRETDTTYKWQTDSNYLSANLVDLPASVQIKNSAGGICGETDFGYDDPNNLVTFPGTTFSHAAAPAAVRGNLTSTSRKLSTVACSINASTSAITSSTKWYDTGEIYQSSDPLGHTTTHSYSSTYYGAYPTQTCNAKNQCVSGTYDPGTGLLTSFTDANHQTGTFDYDPEGRMKIALGPADSSGQKPETDFFYPDLLTVERSKKQDSAHNIIDYAYFDGLGRAKQTQLVDPEGDDFVETTYDGLGHVSSATNPHRTTASSTDGSTTSYYDALGRAVQVAAQDGTLLPAGTAPTSCQPNNICTDYSNFPTVTVTDQAGKLRRSRTDALGRLVEVDEPGPGANTAGTPAWATINISGSLQIANAGTKATGWFQVSGVDEWILDCPPDFLCSPRTSPKLWDSGEVTVSINGVQAGVGYGQGSTAAGLASSLGSQLNPHPVTYSDSGTGTITVTADTPGPNYSLSAASSSNDPTDFSAQGSFSLAVSGPSLTGGVYPTYDSGALTVTVDGFQASASYNQSLNNTPQALASALAAALNVPSSPVTAQANGTGITITAKVVGSAGDYSVSGGSTASFTASSATLGNGTNPGGLFAPYKTLYTWDTLGNLTQVTQNGDGSQPARIRTFAYDSLGRLLTSTNPESGKITYQYNNDGMMISKTDARGITINYSPSDAPIDALHRVLKKTYSNGDPAVTFTYDQGVNGIGHLTSEAVGALSNSYSFDALGRVVSQTDCLPSGCRTITVPAGGYNLASELNSLLYPDTRNVTSTFNTAGQLTGVKLAQFNGTAESVNYYTVPQTTLPATWGYFPTGAMNRGNYGNGLLETTGYNNRLQIGSIADVKGAATLLNKSYGYYDSAGRNNGNVLTITDSLNAAKNQAFTYDALNRLLTASESDSAFNVTYNIDPWGNMKESGTSNFVQTFDSNNRMSGWSYDAAGNLLNDSAHSYTYDAEGRIKTVDGTGATYAYGPDGQRVRKDTSSGSVEYVYFGSQMIAEFNPATGAWTDYIFAGGKRIAKDSSSNATGAQYYQSDHLGSTRIMTDPSGTKISDCAYAPFGEQVACSPDNLSNRYRFTGKERDSETGMDYFGARYYASSMGRFLSADWSGGPATVPYAHLENPQTLNLYAYVDNNPVNGIDPNGHSPHEYMVAGGAYGPNIMEDGPVIETDESGFLDTTTNIATITSVQTSLFTGTMAEALTGLTGQATLPGSPSGTNAIANGTAVGVGERPLLNKTPGADHYYHTYLLVAGFNDGGEFIIHSFGVLGEIKDGKGTSNNQQVRVDDTLGRNAPKEGSGRNHLYILPVTAAQRQALFDGATYWITHQCPECGTNYSRGGPLDANPAYNSNTWVYNMLIHDPAGRIEPPAIAMPAPGWNVNDVGADYYPNYPK